MYCTCKSVYPHLSGNKAPILPGLFFQQKDELPLYQWEELDLVWLPSHYNIHKYIHFQQTFLSETNKDTLLKLIRNDIIPGTLDNKSLYLIYLRATDSSAVLKGMWVLNAEAIRHGPSVQFVSTVALPGRGLEIRPTERGGSWHRGGEDSLVEWAFFLILKSTLLISSPQTSGILSWIFFSGGASTMVSMSLWISSVGLGSTKFGLTNYAENLMLEFLEKIRTKY